MKCRGGRGEVGGGTKKTPRGELARRKEQEGNGTMLSASFCASSSSQRRAAGAVPRSSSVCLSPSINEPGCQHGVLRFVRETPNTGGHLVCAPSYRRSVLSSRACNRVCVTRVIRVRVSLSCDATIRLSSVPRFLSYTTNGTLLAYSHILF